MATGNFAGNREPERERRIDLSLWAKYQKTRTTLGPMRCFASFSITGSGCFRTPGPSFFYRQILAIWPVAKSSGCGWAYLYRLI